MRVILVAGGSGGHIYPCLELAKYYQENKDTVLLCGSKDSLEEKIYLSNNMAFKGLNINKHKLKSYFTNKKEIEEIYAEFKPDFLILFGNYISVSFALVAIIKKIPIYLHEQNVIYGSANKLLGLKAKKIYLSLPIKHNFYKKKSLLVGNPKGEVEIKQGYLNREKKNVVIVMGSLGSTSMNKILKQFINIANSEVIYHLVIGNKYYKDFICDIKIKPNIKLYPYLDNLSTYLSECDVFISRAGATTISEIINLGVCSILIPSPYVKNNHQYKNAKYLLDNNACLLLEEKDLNSEVLLKQINDLLKDDKKRELIKKNALSLRITHTKMKIYEDIKNDYKR